MSPWFLLRLSSIIGILFTMFLIAPILHADTGTIVLPTSTQSGSDLLPSNGCLPDRYELVGPSDLKTLSTTDFFIRTKDDVPLSDNDRVVYRLFKGQKLIETSEGVKYSRTFVEPGETTIEVTISDVSGCHYTIRKTLHTYTDMILYIGNEKDELRLNFDAEFARHNLLYLPIYTPNTGDSSAVSAAITRDVSANLTTVRNASIVIIDTSSPTAVLESLTKLAKLYNIANTDKTFFIADTGGSYGTKRLIGQYFRTLSVRYAGSFDARNTLNLITQLSLGKHIDDIRTIIPFSEVSLGDLPIYWPISWMVDRLVSGGFPLKSVSILLEIPIAVTVLNFSKQVIGLTVFAVLYPILFAISLLLLGPTLSLILLGAAILSIFLVNRFTRHVYLLHNAKISLIAGTYIILVLLVLALNVTTGFFIADTETFQNAAILFPAFTILVVANKIYDEEFSFLRKKDLLSLGEFMILSLIIYGLFQMASLENLLLSFPEIIVLLLVVNVIIGRFTGLQLFEYIRFLPIIQKHFDEEE